MCKNYRRRYPCFLARNSPLGDLEFGQINQIEGVKFRGQQPIETYIVDFFSFDKKIVIEFDGGQHSENMGYRTG
jgi:hypothetical protein